MELSKYKSEMERVASGLCPDIDGDSCSSLPEHRRQVSQV